MTSSNIGRRLQFDEKKKLEIHFLSIPAIQKLCTILNENTIIGKEFNLTDREDLSGIGVNMRWLDPNDQIQEAFDFYPGLAAVKDGFIPIGCCLNGSGDPYFIKEVDKEIRVFRIPHDAVIDDMIDEGQVEYINTLDFLLNS